MVSLVELCKKKLRIKLLLFPYRSILTCVLGAQKNPSHWDGSFEYPQHICFVLFCLIHYIPSTIFQLNRDGSSWVEPVLSKDKCVLLKVHNAVRLEPAAPRSRVKHSTTEPLHSLRICFGWEIRFFSVKHSLSGELGMMIGEILGSILYCLMQMGEWFLEEFVSIRAVTWSILCLYQSHDTKDGL